MLWWDFFLLVVYVLVVYWVLSNAIEKLDKLATISLNRAKLNEELVNRGIEDMVQFRFGFTNPYSLSTTLKVIAIDVVNQSDRTMYVDWDRSTLTNFQGRSRRVIRITPDLTPDLTQPQVESIIPAGQTLQEEITAEDVIKGFTGVESFETAGVIVPIVAAREDRFLVFNLCVWLVIQQPLANGEREPDIQTLIPCEFLIRKSPWTDALPW